MTENNIIPQPIVNGSTHTGSRNTLADRQNPYLLSPPSTDSGTVPNLWFFFAHAYNRLEKGGWAGGVTVRELPIATTLAGVNMRLNPSTESGVREMYWHKEAEWGYIL